MDILNISFAILISSVFSYFYIRIYSKYFVLRAHYYIGFIIFLLTILIQFVTVLPFGLSVGYLGLLSFITYPLALSLVYKTNIFNITFLSLNAILKIYVDFIFFSSLFALIEQNQLTLTWIYSSNYYHLSQALAYTVSLILLLLFDAKLLSDKLKDFFSQRSNLLLIISIQVILIINLIWMSATTEVLPFRWYNIILLLLAFSVEGIYLLLRLFTANSTYFSVFKTHTDTLRKQLSYQLDHYKVFETQTQELLRFKHDYNKVLNSIATLADRGDLDSIKHIVSDSNMELDSLQINYNKYSNNLVYDALLNDYRKRFVAIGANFESIFYINFNLDISEINMIKLFYNVLENAYEALLHVEDASKRLIKIDSERMDAYIKVSFVNTMNAKFSSLNLKSTKADKLQHGFGASIIDKILIQYNGFSNRYTTSDNGVDYYHLEIFLPVMN